MLDLVRLIVAHGGIVLWGIVLTSIVAVTVVIERLWRLLPLRATFARARAACHEQLLGGGVRRAALALPPDNALARTLRAGLSAHEHGPEAVRMAALDAAQREVPAIERGLALLLATTQVAPLLGLLGTVVGLVEAFRAVADAESMAPKLVASGVYQALGTTVAGLAVAIPAFIAYVAVSGLAGRLIQQLEHAATDLPVLTQGAKP